MRFQNTFIPYQAYWSTPFCKWQGALSREHPLKLAAKCAKTRLDDLSIDANSLDALHFGATVPQHQSFFGAPWIAAMLGADRVTGPTISQACATSARLLASAGSAVSLGQSDVILALAADRISNGPHIYYPDPKGPGGMGVSENWVWDNFNNDPHAKVAMVQTAENIAARFGFSRQEQDDLTLHRFGQYEDALANDRAFQKRYMLGVEVKQSPSPHRPIPQTATQAHLCAAKKPPAPLHLMRILRLSFCPMAKAARKWRIWGWHRCPQHRLR